MATPRETLKYYFRKYALPTEQQFAELIDAFVHKDEDMLTQEKIDGLINALAGKVSNETFEAFKTEIQKAITSSGSDFTALTERVNTAEGNITTLREDVDTNADNISGINQRVATLEEKPEITVDSTLDGKSTNPVENKAVTAALGSKADSADVTALEERVSTLENAEPAQVTGNYVKQIADLDNYEGTTGEIVQYIGQTTSTRTRGFFYEKKAGEEKEVTIFYEGKDCYTDVSKYLEIENYNRLYQTYGMTDYGFCTLVEGKTLSAYSAEGITGAFVFKDHHAVGDFYTDTYAYRITDSNLTEDDSTITIGSRTFDKSHEIQMPIWRTSNGKYIASTPRQGDYVQYWVGLTDDFKPYCFGEMNYAQDPTTDTITTDPSWQVIPVGPCVG